MSTKRVQQFLQLEEVDWTHYYVGYNGTSRAESRKGDYTCFDCSPSIVTYLLTPGGYRNAEVDSGATALCMYDAIFSWRGCDSQAGGEGEVGKEGKGEGEGEQDKGGGKEEREEHERASQWTLSNISLNLPTVSYG